MFEGVLEALYVMGMLLEQEEPLRDICVLLNTAPKDSHYHLHLMQMVGVICKCVLFNDK